MPEMTFSVRWPDGQVQDCYSPSLVMWDHLEVGATYAVGDFSRRTTAALAIASDRVRARYGFACSASAATAALVQQSAGRYAEDDLVEVLAMAPPLADAGVSR